MDQQDHIDRIERGRMAALASQTIEEFIEKTRTDLISRMVSLYRSGTLTHDNAVGSIGGLSVLDSLMSELHYAQQQGEVSAQSEYGE